MRTSRLFIVFILVGLSGCSIFSGSPAMSISVSSDGQYAVSAHQNNFFYLWNITTQSKKYITNNANIYSAYFVQGQDIFIWQDLANQVHVHSVQNGELFTFKYPEPVYGHLLTRDLKKYIASDITYQLQWINLENNQTHTLRNAAGKAFLGFGKVLNLSLTKDEKKLITAGYSYSTPAVWKHLERSLEEEAEINNYERLTGVALWSLETLEPLARLDGNSSKTHASISPDGQWVVSGDENGLGRLWNTNTPPQRFDIASYYHGLFVDCDEEYNCRLDKSGLISPPERISSRTVATGFIKDSRYYFHLTFTGASERDPYAVLFEAGNPWPIKYFDLGTRPWPSTREYHRNLTVATAPEAGILVTGQHSKGGINVYQFDAENLTLKRIWVGR